MKEPRKCIKCGKYEAEYNQTYCEFCLGISSVEEYEKELKDKEGLLKRIKSYRNIPFTKLRLNNKEIKLLLSHLDSLTTQNEKLTQQNKVLDEDVDKLLLSRNKLREDNILIRSANSLTSTRNKKLEQRLSELNSERKSLQQMCFKRDYNLAKYKASVAEIRGIITSLKGTDGTLSLTKYQTEDLLTIIDRILPKEDN